MTLIGLKGYARIVHIDSGTLPNVVWGETMNLNGLQDTIAGSHVSWTTTGANAWVVNHEACILETFDPGQPARDETWIHPDGGPSYLGRIIDRPVQMALTIHLQPHVTMGAQTINDSDRHAFLKETVRLIRNQLEFVPNYLQLGESSSDWLVYRTYPSAIWSPFNGQQLQQALVTSQYRLLDWTLSIWRDPYPVSAMYGALTGGGPSDVDHLPML